MIGNVAPLAELEKFVKQTVKAEVESDVTARAIVNKTRVPYTARQARAEAQQAKEAIEGADLVTDDGIPPQTPTGVEVEPIFRGLHVWWSGSPDADYVQKTIVSVTKVSNSLSRNYTVAAPGVQIDVLDLDLTEYRITVTHRDRWGRLSTPSAAITATPRPSVADEIAAELEISAERITGILPSAQLSRITDPAKFAEAVVRSSALAAAQRPNILSWDYAELENYAEGDTLPYRTLGNGNTATIIASYGKKWIDHTRTLDSTQAHFSPDARYIDRTEGEAGFYIYSVQCKNDSPSDTSIRLVTQQAPTERTTAAVAAVTGNVNTLGDYFTVGSGETRRVFVKFYYDPATLPYGRFLHQIETPGNEVWYGRMMLQKCTSPAENEPGAYVPPAMSAGIISSRLLATWDLAAVNAVMGDATITSAKIRELSADKITSGAIQTASLDLIGTGKLRAGGGRTVLDGQGLKLTAINSAAIERPTENVAYKITSVQNAQSAFWFFDTANLRGIVLRADGDPGGTDARMHLQTTRNGDTTMNSSCRVLLDSFGSGFGTVYIGSDLSVDRNLAAGGYIEAVGGLSAYGGFTFRSGTLNMLSGSQFSAPVFTDSFQVAPGTNPATFSHGYSHVPRYMWAQWNDGGQWHWISSGAKSFEIWATSNVIAVRNNGSATRTVRVAVMG